MAESYVTVHSFYQFRSERYSDDALVTLKTALIERAQALEIRGLVILAAEGINGTISGPLEALKTFERTFSLSEDPKESFADDHPFRLFSVKLRDEIVTSGQSLPFEGSSGRYLTPSEWHARLAEKDSLVLDVRNKYESDIGKFRGAIAADTENFADFLQAIEALALPKERPVLMYCTGGIRCEKAAVMMEKLGYDQVFQLHGGIIRYLEEFPEGHFEGECFVFDDRVALDRQRRPTRRYSFCGKCGQPASTEANQKLCVDCIGAHQPPSTEH